MSLIISNKDSSLVCKVQAQPYKNCDTSIFSYDLNVIFTHTTTMKGSKPSNHCEPTKDAQTVFLSKVDEVYRIPSLFYDSDKKILMAFAEQRWTTDDASAKMLVMKTGTLMKDSSDAGTIEVKSYQAIVSCLKFSVS